jgi:hypothetical protein
MRSFRLRRGYGGQVGGYVIAARSLVKCRAFLLGMNGEYNFHPCGLSAFLWQVTGITPDQFKEFVATGYRTDGRWGKPRAACQKRDTSTRRLARLTR